MTEGLNCFVEPFLERLLNLSSQETFRYISACLAAHHRLRLRHLRRLRHPNRTNRGTVMCLDVIALPTDFQANCIDHLILPGLLDREYHLHCYRFLRSGTCQGMANYYGVYSGNGFACAPLEAQAWWLQHGGVCGGSCYTTYPHSGF